MGNYSEIKFRSNKVKFDLVPLIASKQCLKRVDSKFTIFTTIVSGVVILRIILFDLVFVVMLLTPLFSIQNHCC